MFKQSKSVEKAPIPTLSEAEMTKTKGGWLITCEEKRTPLLGIKYDAWSVKFDGSLFFKMG